MNNLVLKTEIEEVTLTSLEVAEMLGKEHKNLLSEIEGRKDGKNVGILQVLERGKFQLSKYFIPSTYKSGNREYKCYEITKMGCHMLGNKLQGEKGILFTAKYVERFNEMEKSLKSGQAIQPKTSLDLLELQVKALKEVNSKVEKLDKKVDDKFGELPLFTVDSKALSKLANKKMTSLLGGKKSPAYKQLNHKGWADLYGQVHREFGVSEIGAIKRKDLEKARQVIIDYVLPTHLKEQVEIANNQIEFEEAN
ncbi:Rha family transcriptional regulator [Clostridium thermobutyricum]|uniref:Rha family transcriptional regulator n=1 Tax=Clostridium thermobutyricum TaxID=29372 RepID=UPI0018AC5791|nr:Rha family transcriptional regulator [Clostridium thermobutyricum]